MVLGGGLFPGPGHLRLTQTAGQGQAEALTRHDRLQVGTFAEGAAVGGR
jgi:hypothetical protein